MTPNITLGVIALIFDCIFFYMVFLVIRGIFRFFKRLFSSKKDNYNFPQTDKTFWHPSTQAPATDKVFWPPYIPSPTALPIPIQEEKYPYEKQNYLLTPTELKFYRVLKPICDERNLAIFAKVRLEDLVTVPEYVFNNWKWRGYIRSRHIDFVLCDASNLKVRCGIELDDWHHKFFKNQQIDERKDKIMRDAGLALIRVEASRIYNPTELGQIIDNKA